MRDRCPRWYYYVKKGYPVYTHTCGSSNIVASAHSKLPHMEVLKCQKCGYRWAWAFVKEE